MINNKLTNEKRGIIKKIEQFTFPDVEKLSSKDSDISTKRYADLRIINHFICMSWVSLIVLIYSRQWYYITCHLGIVGAFAFLRGALALESIKNFIGNKK